MAKMLIEILCPTCETNAVSLNGKTVNDKQRCICNNESCSKNTFITDYSYNGSKPSTPKVVIDMALNGSGIRDTSRVLGISTDTVMSVIKNMEPELITVNTPLIEAIDTDNLDIDVVKVKSVDEAEIDEMWSFVGSKINQRWLWHAIDHNTGKVLAYVLGSRKDVVFLKLKALLEPFNIKMHFTDDWGAYNRHIDNYKHEVGKRNTQKIERKHLTLRTRIKRLTRKTICFSKTNLMHDILIGMFVNRYEFGARI